MIIIIAICTVYTKLTIKKYSAYDNNIIIDCPCDYSPIANDCSGGPFTLHLYGRKVFMSAYGIWLNDYKKDIDPAYRYKDNNDIFIHPYLLYARLTDFEYCLIRDYAHNVLEPLYDPDDFGRYTGNASRPAYSIYCGTDDPYTTNFHIYGSDPRIVLFVLMLAFPLYIRHSFPLVILLWLIFFAVVKFAAKGYFKGKNLSRIEKLRLINQKCDIGIKYVFFSCTFIVLTGLLLASPALANLTDGFSYKMLKMHGYDAFLGVNIFGFALFAASQIYILLKLADGNKIRLFLSYIIPTFILYHLHKLLFYKLLGTSEFYFGKYALFVRSVLGINEGVPFFSKVVAFTLFFIVGVVIYFIFGFISGRNLRKNLAQSTAFAAVNAFMCCSVVYIMNFGHSILYNTHYFMY